MARSEAYNGAGGVTDVPGYRVSGIASSLDSDVSVTAGRVGARPLSSVSALRIPNRRSSGRVRCFSSRYEARLGQRRSGQLRACQPKGKLDGKEWSVRLSVRV
jgi:hypothetical protein